MKSKIACFLLFVVAAFIILPPYIVFADELGECIKTANGSQGGIGCYVQELERLDTVLEAKHKEMLYELEGDLKPYMINEEKIQWLKKKATEAHQHWKKYRAAYCSKFTYESVPGTGASLAAVRCSILLTKHRIEELRAGR